jgi:hypothetical protein
MYKGLPEMREDVELLAVRDVFEGDSIVLIAEAETVRDMDLWCSSPLVVLVPPCLLALCDTRLLPFTRALPDFGRSESLKMVGRLYRFISGAIWMEGENKWCVQG